MIKSTILIACYTAITKPFFIRTNTALYLFTMKAILEHMLCGVMSSEKRKFKQGNNFL